MSNSNSAILSCAMVTLGSTTGASILPAKYGGKGELPAPRLLIGTALTFTGLSVLSDFAPQLAVPLALALAVTAATYYGIPLLDNYFKNGSTTP